jgi:hypothetical protein
MSALSDLKTKRWTPLTTCILYVEKYGGSKANRETAENAAAELATLQADLAAYRDALAARDAALRIHMLFNPITSDKDSYLWRVAEYALGEDDEFPNPSDYGLDGDTLWKLAAALERK